MKEKIRLTFLSSFDMSPLVQYLNSQLKKILCLMTSYNHRHTLTIVIVAISDLKPKVDVNIHYLYLHSLSSKFTPSICAPWLHVLVLMLNRLKYLYNTPLLTVFFQDNYISKFCYSCLYRDSTLTVVHQTAYQVILVANWKILKWDSRAQQYNLLITYRKCS